MIDLKDSTTCRHVVTGLKWNDIFILPLCHPSAHPFIHSLLKSIDATASNRHHTDGQKTRYFWSCRHINAWILIAEITSLKKCSSKNISIIPDICFEKKKKKQSYCCGGGGNCYLISCYMLNTVLTGVKNHGEITSLVHPAHHIGPYLTLYRG